MPPPAAPLKKAPPAPVPPVADRIGALLRGLLGRTVAVRRVPSTRPLDRTATAIYETDGRATAALLLCDLAIAAGAGAALSLQPAATAAECVKAKRLGALTEESYQEVANVAAQLFNAPGLPHLKLQRIVYAPAALPPGAAEVLAKPVARADYDATIDGYGAGRVTILMAAV